VSVPETVFPRQFQFQQQFQFPQQIQQQFRKQYVYEEAS
jgi:hypothetical protein